MRCTRCNGEVFYAVSCLKMQSKMPISIDTFSLALTAMHMHVLSGCLLRTREWYEESFLCFSIIQLDDISSSTSFFVLKASFVLHQTS